MWFDHLISLRLRHHAHGTLAKRLMHMAHLSGNTSGVSKSSSDWLNYTGFPGDVCVAFFTPLRKKKSVVFTTDDERLSGSTKRWIFKDFLQISATRLHGTVIISHASHPQSSEHFKNWFLSLVVWNHYGPFVAHNLSWKSQKTSFHPAALISHLLPPVPRALDIFDWGLSVRFSTYELNMKRQR